MGIFDLLQDRRVLVIAVTALCFTGAGLAFLGISFRNKDEALASRVDALRAKSNSIDARKLEAHARTAAVFHAGIPEGENRARQFSRLLHLPVDHAKVIFLVFRVVLAVLLGAGLLLLGYHWGATPSPFTAAALAGTAIGIAWLVPMLLTEVLSQRRVRAIEHGLPEAIELLIIAVEAGLALEDAMDRIVAELRHSRPVIAEQLALTAADLKILPDRQLALAKLAERVDLPSVRSLVTTLNQTMRYGTPLAHALRVVAAELRNDSLLRLEERANKLPVILTIPMVAFMLPALFLILGGPVVLKLLRIVLPH